MRCTSLSIAVLLIPCSLVVTDVFGVPPVYCEPHGVRVGFGNTVEMGARITADVTFNGKTGDCKKNLPAELGCLKPGDSIVIAGTASDSDDHRCRLWKDPKKVANTMKTDPLKAAAYLSDEKGNIINPKELAYTDLTVKLGDDGRSLKFDGKLPVAAEWVGTHVLVRINGKADDVDCTAEGHTESHDYPLDMTQFRAVAAVPAFEMRQPQTLGATPKYFRYWFNDAGVCQVNCFLTTSPNTPDVRKFLNDKIKWTIEEVKGSKPTWLADKPYAGDMAVYIAPYKDWEAKAVFTGMPAHNSSFGRKKAAYVVKVLGFTQQGLAKIFFQRDSLNHPGTGSGTTANWYYYWIDGNVVKDLSDMTYGGEHKFYLGQFIQPATLKIYAKAAGSQGEIPRIHHYWNVDKSVDQPVYDPKTGYWRGKVVPKATFKARQGIYLCRSVILHEKKHKANYDAITTGGDTDKDGDTCPDSMEGKGKNAGAPSYFSALYPDTYNWGQIYKDYKDQGDGEHLARIAGEGVDEKDLKPEDDWSDTNGCNWNWGY